MTKVQHFDVERLLPSPCQLGACDVSEEMKRPPMGSSAYTISSCNTRSCSCIQQPDVGGASGGWRSRRLPPALTTERRPPRRPTPRRHTVHLNFCGLSEPLFLVVLALSQAWLPASSLPEESSALSALSDATFQGPARPNAGISVHAALFPLLPALVVMLLPP